MLNKTKQLRITYSVSVTTSVQKIWGLKEALPQKSVEKLSWHTNGECDASMAYFIYVVLCSEFSKSLGICGMHISCKDWWQNVWESELYSSSTSCTCAIKHLWWSIGIRGCETLSSLPDPYPNSSNIPSKTYHNKAFQVTTTNTFLYIKEQLDILKTMPTCCTPKK